MQDLEYKFEDFVNMAAECKECINVIQDLMTYPLMEVNTNLDSTLITRLINVIIKYKEQYEDFPDINFWLHQSNKLITLINHNKFTQSKQRAVVNSNGTIHSETWHNIWLNSKKF